MKLVCFFKSPPPEGQLNHETKLKHIGINQNNNKTSKQHSNIKTTLKHIKHIQRLVLNALGPNINPLPGALP